MSIEQKIQDQIQSHPIVLYMKGTADFPQCGFSGRVVHILKQCGVPFVTHNILEDDDLRQGIKEFSSWPTLPQLYINGEFIGGSDIVGEMYNTGELQELLSKVRFSD